MLFGVGLWIVALLARPLTRLKLSLLGTMAAVFGLAIAVPGVRNFFALDVPPANIWVVVVVAIGSAGALVELGTRFAARRGVSSPASPGRSVPPA